MSRYNIRFVWESMSMASEGIPSYIMNSGLIGRFVVDDASRYGMHQGILMGHQGTPIPRLKSLTL